VINAGPDTVRLTGGMEFGGPVSAEPSPRAVTSLRTAAQRVVPALRSITAPGTAWRGARPMTPSGLPLIGAIGENLVAATGHGTLGMTLAPATGRIVASILLHQTCCPQASPDTAQPCPASRIRDPEARHDCSQ
jgi:D-amino-acid dehydrogenase